MTADPAPVELDTRVLSNPVWHALRGPQRGFALGAGTAAAVRFRREVAPFGALDLGAEPGRAWADLARLMTPGDRVAVLGEDDLTPPDPWVVTDRLATSRFVDTDVQVSAGDGSRDDLVRLGRADLSEMLELVDITRPGPFGPATVDLGGYLGVRRDGRLAAMAGRRFAPPGWIEVSAVCTHPDFRGQGLSRRLLAAVIADIRADGARAFLHVLRSNTVASELYLSMGFTRQADVTVSVLRLS